MVLSPLRERVLHSLLGFTPNGFGAPLLELFSKVISKSTKKPGSLHTCHEEIEAVPKVK
jgi:hypothetical protein